MSSRARCATCADGSARSRSRARPLAQRGGATQPAATRYRRLALVSGHALLAVSPQSGRTHQIRRHLAGVGTPVLGDARYGHAASNRHAAERHGLDRPFLHCAVVELRHPETERPLRFEAPLAPDLAAVLARAGGTAFDVAALRATAGST